MGNTSSRLVAGSRSGWIVLALIALGAIDLLMMAHNHTEAEDSYQYIMDVTKGTNLFLPNHLLSSPINWVHYRLWTTLGYSGNATVPMEVTSVIASLASVYLVYRIALRVGATPFMALAAAGWTAFSFGFWVYSLEAETYVAPIPFMLLSILLLFRVHPTGWRHVSGKAATRLIALGGLTAIAALLHQQYLFVLPIVIVSLILIWRATPGRTIASLITTVATYSTVAVALISVAYTLVGVVALGHSSIGQTIAWARGHATYGVWSTFTPMSLPLMLVGFVRAVFGVNFLGSPYAGDVIPKIFFNRTLLTRRYLAEHYIGTASFWLIVAAMLAALAASAWLALRLVRSIRAGATIATLSPRWIFTRFAVTYVLVYLPLILIWEPASPKFWIAVVPVLAILIACQLGSDRGVVPASLLLVVALFVVNLVGAVWPYSHADSDYWTNQNAGLAALAHNGDVIIVTECSYPCLGNLELGTGARVIEAASDDTDVLESALASPKTRVFVSSWAFDPPPGVAETEDNRVVQADLEGHPGNGKVRTMLEGMRSRLVDVGRSGSQVIWQVAPPK